MDAGCGFVNCIPTRLAQREDFQRMFVNRGLPLLGDDIKSQMGTTILHRALLSLLDLRGADLTRTSQINVGGNTDFVYVYARNSSLTRLKKDDD